MPPIHPEVAAERARLAATVQNRGADSAAAHAARRNYQDLLLERHIIENLAMAPPMTTAKRRKFATLLWPGIVAVGTDAQAVA